MNTFALLLRGINVGGKNKVPMAELRQCPEAIGFTNVMTYIASGNAIITTPLDAREVAATVEAELLKRFKLDAELIRVLVISPEELKSIVTNKPHGFGEQPEKYHSDAIFLIGIDAVEALSVFSPKEGVDMVWPGKGVIYSQRLSALRTKSRLNKIMSTSVYKYMTIRNWNTTMALSQLLEEARAHR